MGCNDGSFDGFRLRFVGGAALFFAATLFFGRSVARAGGLVVVAFFRRVPGGLFLIRG